jgi:hypothetical protein
MAPESGDPPSAAEEARPTRGSLIFISHDSRDAALAEALSKLLNSVSAGMLKTFRSSDKKGSQGFEYGVEWYPELMKTLDSACDVVCLLTERGLGRPWMLYEAGVAKGKLDIPVHGLALGVPLAKASVGPFAQFQNCGDDVESLTKLVAQLVQRLPNADPDLETVRTQVKVFKAQVEKKLAEDTDGDDKGDTAPGEASPAKLFEEIKVMFQDLPSRLEQAGLDEPRRSRSGFRRFHPAMVEELVMMTSRGRPSVGFAAIVIASFFRDDVPWLYELAAEAYRLSVLGDTEAERRAAMNFARTAEMLGHGPFVRELRMGKDVQLILRDTPMILDRYFVDRGESAAPDEE